MEIIKLEEVVRIEATPVDARGHRKGNPLLYIKLNSEQAEMLLEKGCNVRFREVFNSNVVVVRDIDAPFDPANAHGAYDIQYHSAWTYEVITKPWKLREQVGCSLYLLTPSLKEKVNHDLHS